MKNVKKIIDSDSRKAAECAWFAQNEALAVHVENLVAFYGETAVKKILAVKTKKQRKAV